MIKWILFIIMPFPVWAQSPVALERLSTEYIMESGKVYPSCLMVKHRRLEREKVLREMRHSVDYDPLSQELLAKDNYLFNKYFLDEELWSDESIEIKNVWRAPVPLLSAIAQDRDQVFFELKGDGIGWKEKLDFFPDEVSFEVNELGGVIVSRHRTYYADYCEPSGNSELTWFPLSVVHPVSTTFEVQAVMKVMKMEGVLK